ncbi:hypothetical protein PENSPDRAFT_688873 [Peniophora sp. CONT]|nr:hypothetical protein PENSPDRAFT_688873 [Peniophora sp. CONT]
MGSQDNSDWVVDITQNFDDDLRMLDMSLVTMMAASRGDYDFTELDSQKLAASWRSMESSSAMLRVALHGFSRRHARVVNCLASSRSLSESSRAKLLERTKAPRKVFSMDVLDVWQGFIALDQQSYLYLTRNQWDDIARGSEIALQLEMAVNWIEDAIEVLRGCYSRIEHARIVQAPILRLNTDVLTIIFNQLAEFEVPSMSTLGWIRLSHVCSIWREVLMEMHSLWARDAYAFGPVTARRHILSRVQSSLISITARRLPAVDDGKLRLDCDQVVRFSTPNDVEPILQLAVERSLRDIYVEVYHGQGVRVEGMQALADLMVTLGEFEQPHLRSLSIAVPWSVKDSEELPCIQMAPHPVLRRIDLVNIFIPFSLPRLSSLRLFCNLSQSSEDSTMTSSWLDGLLDALASCPALTDFRLIGWTMPPSPPQPRKITLNHLATLCSTTSEILLFLELPTLQRGYIADNGRTTNTYAGLTAVLTRYGYSPRSVQLSQRSARGVDRVIVRFGRIAEPWSHPIDVPFNATSLLTDPGPYLTFAVPCTKALTARTLSAVFPVFATLVSRLPNTNDIETLGFDNETREHTFYDPSGNTHFRPMLLPAFPSVRTIELPLKDKDTMRHVLSSLVADQNIGSLPLLSCIRFIGPLDFVDNVMEMHQLLSLLLSARSSLQGVSPIKFMEIAVFPGGTQNPRDDDGVEPSKPTIMRLVMDGVGADATLRVESMADNGGWEVSESTASST